ncbi:MAG TPA: CDP-alcohol phosphatidyltransferase family protein [Acidimicrobiia bacterium]|nr:CDP-alcohol phosphatidyltransferase family protein [Acidimicrobiia bacterium]
MSRRILTIPNVISLARVAMVPLFLWLLFGADSPLAAGLLVGAIGATDWVDGFLARRLDQVSELGKLLDPVADRLAITAAVIGGWVAGVLPWPVALALVVREVLIGVGAAIAWRWGLRVEVRFLGKVATFALYSAVGSFFVYAGFDHPLFLWWGWGVAVAGLILYYLVGVQYFFDILRARREPTPVSSG